MIRRISFVIPLVVALTAADWPQWRGPNRDARAAGFTAPATWPKELTKKWSVTIGDGVATPALVGDRLYTYSREGDDEVARCLDAATGKELWQDKFDAMRPTGGAGGFPGPRSSPTVVDGKVVTFGVDSTLTCYDAATGKKLWRKDNLGDVPMFFTSASPVVADVSGGKLVIVQYGGERGGGGVVAYDLASGARKWVWKGEGASYGSPALMTVDGTQVVVVPTSASVVALNPTDGSLLWKAPFPTQQMVYNAATPVVAGETMIYSGSGGRGRGTKAFRFEKAAGGATAKEMWTTGEAVQFNTPVLKDGQLYGISDEGKLFCMDAASGKVSWTAPLKRPSGRTRPGYGSVVDAGSVMFALNPSGELVVFEPNPTEFKKVATYQVAAGDTFAYPVIADKRIFIKDKNTVTLWTVE